MASGPIAVEGSAVGALASWANGQDGWVRMLTSAVLARRIALDGVTIQAAYEQLLAEKGLSESPASSVPDIEISEAPADDVPPLRLLRISETSSINRLVDRQEIAFNDRITVIYGENASGKTGYARVLKQVSGARSAGPVLPDVYTNSPGTPSATIDYSVGSDGHSHLWRDGGASVPDLGRVCVFDAPAAPLHVDDDLQYLYTPADIALFEYLHGAISRVRELLSAERSRQAPKGNPFLSRFRRGTPQFALVESLRASTDLHQLEQAAARVADEESVLTRLQDRVRNLAGAGQQEQLAGARAMYSLCNSTIAVVDVLLEFDGQAYKRAIRDLAGAEKRAREVNEALFAGDDLPGLFSTEWTAFIDAGHDYGRTHLTEQFPDDIDECPYCRQTLSGPSRELISKYQDYLLDDSQADVRRAREAVNDVVSSVLALQIGAQDNVADDGDDIAAAVLRIRRLALRQQQRLGQRQPWDLDEDLGSLHEARKVLEKQRVASSSSVRDLSTEASTREKELEESKTALLELEDRRTLRSLLDGVSEQVQATKWADHADAVLRAFQGLLRGLTDAMKEATRDLLNSAFESAFQSECQLLNCPSVRLEFPGRHAATLRHKSVGANHRLGEVLSEGEQKVIALADFLAEVSMRPSSAPIILDDPITSLDARRTDEVAERIINLSIDQQVIVFTHHLYFATKLLDAYESSSSRGDCSFYEILSEDGQIGLVLRGEHPRMDTVKSFTGRINRTLQDAKAASGAARSDLIATAYGHIRGWIEAFIEDDLLQGSVKRHRANISIDALSRVNGTAVDEAVRILQPIFDRSCEWIWPHAHTADQLQARPTIEAVEEDWAALKRVAAAVKDGTFPIPPA